MQQFIGIDIGGTKCAVILGCEKSGGIELLEREKVDTADYVKPHAMMDKLAEITTQILHKHKLSPAGIGISCGGPLNSKTGQILSPPNLPGWDEVSICDFFF